MQFNRSTLTQGVQSDVQDWTPAPWPGAATVGSSRIGRGTHATAARGVSKKRFFCMASEYLLQRFCWDVQFPARVLGQVSDARAWRANLLRTSTRALCASVQTVSGSYYQD